MTESEGSSTKPWLARRAAGDHNWCLQVPLAAYGGTHVTPREKCNGKMCYRSSQCHFRHGRRVSNKSGKDSERTNRARGVPEDAGINISLDGQYNSMVIVSRRKAGQNASHTVGIAIEQQTAKKKNSGSIHGIQTVLDWLMAQEQGF